MFQSPEFCKTLSLKLSEVLEDVGVNEEIVMKRRRMYMLRDSLATITFRLIGEKKTVYHLGSQSEGTTTLGLDSDIDLVYVDYNYNVIQDWAEWKQNKTNLLMIQDENVTPGYCFLQLLRSDEPLFETNIPNEQYIRDSIGRILLKNTFVTPFIGEDIERHGPSNTISMNNEYCAVDLVIAYPCNSRLQTTSQFLERACVMRWLQSESVRYAASCDCFVVGTGSKIATYQELEWRISTSLAERCLMFNLNITQLQCYVLLKIILKNFLNPHTVNALSSFMCKTVLFHCVENTEQSIWKKDNIFACLSYCLLELHSYVQSENCPHFIISDNNLMAGHFTAEEKRDILQKLCDIIQSDGRYLLRLSMDNISQRLQVKLCSVVHIAYSFQTSLEIYEKCSSQLFSSFIKGISASLILVFNYLSNDHMCNLKKIILKLTNYSVRGNRVEQLSNRCLAPFIYSTLGLMMASSSIGQNNPVQYEALQWLTLGLNSDVTSGKLKLASMFYCAGDVDRVEFILRQTENRYNSTVVEPLCGCWLYPPTSHLAEFKRKCSELSEKCINSITSCCVKFTQKEVNCVPRELRYEMMRSTQDDMPYRSMLEKFWMDYAVVDSLPYLYFLQYKTYSYLQRHQNQERALSNLAKVIFTERNFGHRETALNLLGQCMEQENKPRGALQCYILSLQQRERNNAANFHICNLLRKCASNM
ncbi:uncharacterized protein LOC132715669 isoform X2 [Ruditapes philippinarum]|uniref:uncharacterized protein LOC132715669 isoform X2 n=1 Tax=Ruditapes philippinarum TaxID=129788 RepID=UPI00295B6E94|nr:uncharacterized protein LOC132715669 isoform X2 [Ruditapes philippinarum]